MTQEEKIQFINENINLVPNVMKSRFEKMDVEEQYKRIQRYIERQKEIDEKPKSVIAARVKEMMEKKAVTIEDATAIIEVCNTYIESYRQHEIEQINQQIELLTARKAKLEEKK